MFDNVLVTIAFVLAGFFGIVLPWLRRRVERWRRKRLANSVVAQNMVAVPPLPTVARPMPARYASLRTPAAPDVGSVVARHRRRPLGSLSDARRGIVLITLLSPCRALQPPQDGMPGERG